MSDEIALGERMLRWADPSNPEGDGGEPVCEWCCVVVPDGDSAFAPYCSEECSREAFLEERIETWEAGGEQGSVEDALDPAEAC